MPLTLCPYVYNPIESTTFTVHFDTVVGTHEQNQRAERVIAHLNGLEYEALLEESIRFFKWVVLYHTTECNLLYAERLLEFFHGRGLLLSKPHVNNPVKQKTERYLVIFSMKGHVFTKIYHSIREIVADTGKKPSQIQRLRTDQMLCKPLKGKSSSV
jgi:hypothetical protein